MYTLVDIWPPRLQGSNKEISNRRWNDLAQHPSHSLTLACLHGVWAKGRVPLALRKRYAGCPRSVCCETFWGGAWYSSWTSFFRQQHNVSPTAACPLHLRSSSPPCPAWLLRSPLGVATDACFVPSLCCGLASTSRNSRLFLKIGHDQEYRIQCAINTKFAAQWHLCRVGVWWLLLLCAGQRVPGG